MADKTNLIVGAYTVTFSNADKVLFPNDGITKGDLVDYYYHIAKYMVPHLKGRPLTMQRFPDGIAKEGFFQKQASDYFPTWIKRVTMEKYGGTTDYVVCDHAAALVHLAGQNCITHHIWLSRYDMPHNPDLMVFDLDPSGDSFEPVRRTAFALRDLLLELGMAVFVKSTGSRGLHVTVPLDRSYGYNAVRAFADEVAGLMVSRNPEELTIEQRIEKRQGRVFIDTLRNSYSQTAVAPYTVRARTGAPVAVPLYWEELKDPHLNPQTYNISNISKRLSKHTDPWENIYENAHPFNESLRRLDEIKMGK